MNPDPALRLPHVHLRVSDLARSLGFYRDRLGFAADAPGAATAGLSIRAGTEPLLTLTEDRDARPAPPGCAGLFHAALLLPSRAALAHWLRRTIAAEVAFDGFSDHGVSEAIYLSDPDGNGLEFYCDRPSAGWPRRDGEIAMYTTSLDVRSLLRETPPADNASLAAGSRWGHLHLRVTDLERSQAFYATALGLAVTQSSYPGARFLAADGYHHHLGLNTWGGVRDPQPEGALGLVSATFARVGGAAASTLRDPDGIELRIGKGAAEPG